MREFCGLSEIRHEHIFWVGRDRLRQVDSLVDSSFETDQHASAPAADALNRACIALQDIANIALLQSSGATAALAQSVFGPANCFIMAHATGARAPPSRACRCLAAWTGLRRRAIKSTG
jgi:hypothetical protein